MSTRNANLKVLEDLSKRLKTKVAVRAVHAGLDVLERGVKNRCPVGPTHRLYESIHQSKVGVGKHSVGGAVLVTAPFATIVEFTSHPFVRTTRRVDGPKAIEAMKSVIRSSI